ncbi:MAG: (2Fe-2S)-binding protein [Deltaproteobacteria bacterium]|nr:MAG: (2Fe-2S)-binding protein [Deltaproteobacteria bacterium]
MILEVTLNGEAREIEISPSETLMTLLRRLRLFSVKHGCETGDCGTCTVLLDGKPVHSCILLAAQAHGHEITTVEGIGSPRNLHPLQTAFLDTGAVQCGYCTPAMILVGYALIREKGKTLTEAEVRRALAGTLCRCTGYVKPVEAILQAAKDTDS